MHKKEILCYVNKMFKSSGKLITEENDVELVGVIKIDPEAAYTTISADKKKTDNLGNYNSCSYSVFMSVPCPLDSEQIELAYEFVSKFTENKIKEISESINSKRK